MPFRTTESELRAFIEKEKYIVIPAEGLKPHSHREYADWASDFYDANGVTIPGWFFRVLANPPSEENCKENYSIFKSYQGKKEPVARLDVAPSRKRTHKHSDGNVFHGTHLHELDTVSDVALELECFDRDNRINWLNFMAKKYNFTIKDNTPSQQIGGWPWSA
ncbi:hypothetical protein [Hydrogenovibrio sp. JE_KL2]|uniref:hypothetical protein n=1 Tax=Hydrogenovibrio sp. JE_KL2 TaxID=2651188 RepID=UPI00128DE8B0|nr:hypothetical protein [Hydrogenovibrio sp. JE_KL2]MPQ76888.1 hypothetical protein [Hydrogenovibrio sp. JE_KL2]